MFFQFGGLIVPGHRILNLELNMGNLTEAQRQRLPTEVNDQCARASWNCVGLTYIDPQDVEQTIIYTGEECATIRQNWTGFVTVILPPANVGTAGAGTPLMAGAGRYAT
jgi:hypothetical protein